MTPSGGTHARVGRVASFEIVSFPSVRHLRFYDSEVSRALFDVLSQQHNSGGSAGSEDCTPVSFPKLEELTLEKVRYSGSHEILLACLKNRRACNLGIQKIQLLDVKFDYSQSDILPSLREIVPCVESSQDDLL